MLVKIVLKNEKDGKNISTKVLFNWKNLICMMLNVEEENEKVLPIKKHLCTNILAIFFIF
jgi:hypothetical protein